MDGVHVNKRLAILAQVVFAGGSDAMLEDFEVPRMGTFGTAEDEDKVWVE
jgi:hypothetical protein